MEMESHNSYLPENEEDKIQFGFRLIQNAHKSKTASLENEIRNLKVANEEKQNSINSLQKKINSLEFDRVASIEKTQQLTEENKHLLASVRSMRKQIEKLEKLKQCFVDTLETHGNTASSMSADSSGADAMLYPSGEGMLVSSSMISHQGEHSYSRIDDIGKSFESGSYRHNTSSMQPAQSSIPRLSSDHGSPSKVSNTSPSPQAIANDSSGFLSQGPTSGFGSDGAFGGGEGHVDGKRFFRNARSKLNYESFNEFLANIKRLNNHQISREEALEEAARIFGDSHQDLYAEFMVLMNRHA